MIWNQGSSRNRWFGGQVPRRVGAVLITATLGIGCVVTSSGVASASGSGPAPVLVLQTSGGIIRDSSVINNGTPLTVSVGGLLQEGTGSRELRIDLDQGTVYQSGGVTAPEGWTIEYSTDHGATWSATEPTPASGVTNVRATNASVVAGSSDGSSQNYTRSVTSNVPAGTFGASTGGDGWDVFFYDNYVLNIFHHNYGLALDCHLRAATTALEGGARCPGFDPTDFDQSDGVGSFFTGYATSDRSSGWVDGATGKMYALVARMFENPSWDPGDEMSPQFVGTPGVVCVNLDVVPPTDCGFTALSTSTNMLNFGSSFITNTAEVGGKLFAMDNVNHQLLCFDTVTKAACVDPSISLESGLNPNDYFNIGKAQILAMGTKVYASTDSTMYCFKSSDLSPCPGSWPVTFDSLSWVAQTMPPVLHMDRNGVADGVCLMTGCLDMTGAVKSAWVNPFSITGWLEPETAPSMMFLYGWYGSFLSSTGRAYMTDVLATGDFENPVESTVHCFDFTTEQACAGFDTTPFESGMGIRLYALRADPSNPTCIFTNSDPGQITIFDGVTGDTSCSGNPVITMTPSQFAPRFVCATSGGIDRWKSITLKSVNGGAAATQKLTVRKSNGDAINGWTNVPLTVGTEKSLASLAVADSGSRPTFNVSFSGVTGIITSVVFDIVYEGRGPELCVNTVLNNTTVTGAPACPVIQSIAGKLSENVSTAVTGTALSRSFTISGDANQCPQNIKYASTPGAPRDAICTTTKSGVSTTFKSPLDDGGANIRWYEISLDDGATWTKLTSQLSGGTYTATHSASTTGVSTCNIRAVNLIGSGTVGSASLTEPPKPRSDSRVYSTAPKNVVVGYGILVVPKANRGTSKLTSLTPRTCAGVGGYVVTLSPGRCFVWVRPTAASSPRKWISTVRLKGNPIGSTATNVGGLSFSRSTTTYQGNPSAVVAGIGPSVSAVVVIGHTAIFTGRGGNNAILSLKRALVVRDALVAAGLKKPAYAVGYGGLNTLTDVLTEPKQKTNRRVVIFAIY